MKKLFLTSDLGCAKFNDEGKRVVSKIDNSNNILDILKNDIKVRNKLVIFSGYPSNKNKNIERYNLTKESFEISDFKFNKVIMIEEKNDSDIINIIKDADLILLAGGHLPSQNKWFNKINLKEILEKYEGIVLGESAGSMNCADVVYFCPEREGEAIDPNFNRWLSGLALTNINIFPHFDKLKNYTVDGLNLFYDIVLKDSYKNVIYALDDGAFIEICNDKITFYGECFKIFNGNIIRVNK